MGRAVDIIAGRGGGVALSALTANTNSTFTVRNAADGSRIYLVTLWVQALTAGEVRIRSGLLHDPADGIRLRVIADEIAMLIPPQLGQGLYPQDLLTVELQSGAAATDVVAAMVYYENLTGADARTDTWSNVQTRIKNIHGVRENAAASATAGDTAQPQALNADQDEFKRNKDYALLGVTSDVDAALIGIIGAGTGGFVNAVPSETTSPLQGWQWAMLSLYSGLPLIPIINGADVPASNMVLTHRVANQAVNADFVFAELD